MAAMGRNAEGAGPSVALLLLAGVVRAPGSGQQLGTPGVRPAAGDAVDGVPQVFEARRVGELAVDDEGHEHREAPGALIGTGEQVVLAPERGPALVPLDMRVRE